MIIMVVAHGDNLVIGKNGWMPWDLPEDLKMFRNITLNHKICMGRTTFEVMKKPLPKRHTYVITNQKNYFYEHKDVSIVNDFDALLSEYKNSDENLYVCGGAKIYTHALAMADEMYVSLVDAHYEGDTFFPKYEHAGFIVKTKQKKEGFTLIHFIKK